MKEPFIDVEDIADVAVAALTDRKHVGQVYELQFISKLQQQGLPQLGCGTMEND